MNKLHKAIDNDIMYAVNAAAAGLCSALKDIDNALVVHEQIDPMLDVRKACDEHRKQMDILV